jgi:hypothetical protein
MPLIVADNKAPNALREYKAVQSAATRESTWTATRLDVFKNTKTDRGGGAEIYLYGRA